MKDIKNSWITFSIRNKKVLLRERKRHTARRLVIARYAALSPDLRGVPHPDLRRGTPPPVSWMGYPPYLDLGWGTDRQTPVKTVLSLVLRTRAIIILVKF